MLRTRLSRASLAALAIAALASGSALVASDTAQAGRIDPGFSRGPARIDPGIGNGTKTDPGFGKNSGPKFTVERAGGYQVNFNCHWEHKPGWHFKGPSMIKVCD